jgi:hypothetical protein
MSAVAAHEAALTPPVGVDGSKVNSIQEDPKAEIKMRAIIPSTLAR